MSFLHILVAEPGRCKLNIYKSFWPPSTTLRSGEPIAKRDLGGEALMRPVIVCIFALGIGVSACERGATADANARPATGAPSSSLASEPARPAPSAGAAASAATGAPAAAPTAGGSPAASDAAARSAAPASATAVREATLPTGTRLPIVLDTSVGSDTSRVEETVQGHLSSPVVLHGDTVLAQGTRVGGVVTSAERSGKVKGRAHIAVRFDTITPRGDDERYRIRTAAVQRTAAATKKKDAVKIGGGAAGGAIIGAIVGGKKGAAVGTAVGGGAGTAAVLSTRGDEVHLPKGSALTLRLSEPVTIRIRR
jgi:hypothetical protein